MFPSAKTLVHEFESKARKYLVNFSPPVPGREPFGVQRKLWRNLTTKFVSSSFCGNPNESATDLLRCALWLNISAIAKLVAFFLVCGTQDAPGSLISNIQSHAQLHHNNRQGRTMHGLWPPWLLCAQP